MDADRVLQRGLDFDSAVGAKLCGFELRFNKRSRVTPVSGRANLAQRHGSVTHGVLYGLKHPSHIVNMDPFEHAPIDYRRLIMEVESEHGMVVCWTYIANPSVVDESLKPVRSYLNHLLAGRSFLPHDYVAQLESIECNER